VLQLFDVTGHSSVQQLGILQRYLEETDALARGKPLIALIVGISRGPRMDEWKHKLGDDFGRVL
jgi:hypothetical protein